MKILFVCATLAVVLVATAVAAVSDQIVVSDALINTINSHPRATWKAGHNAIFKGKTMSQIRGLFGLFLMDSEFQNTLFPEAANVTINAAAIPDSFDAAKQWPTCKTINGIRDQGSCRSCWAFSGSEVLSDRFCIATNGAVNEPLSPQDMVSCDDKDIGCQGGYLDKLWGYLESTGIVTDECMPYRSAKGDAPPCTSTCEAGSGAQFKKYKAKKGSSKFFHSVAEAQAAIMKDGPIQTGFKVYRDFFTYKSGVYRHISGGMAGGHAVKVTGWGVDKATGTPYWIAANSWSESFGMGGFFWIERGNNECGFESGFIAGTADV